MNEGTAQEIARRFAASISWRGKRSQLNTHLQVLQTAGVLVVSSRGAFSLERRWPEKGKGIRIEFYFVPPSARQSRGTETISWTSLTTERSGWDIVESIEEPGLQACLVAVLTGDFPEERTLKTQLR